MNKTLRPGRGRSGLQPTTRGWFTPSRPLARGYTRLLSLVLLGLLSPLGSLAQTIYVTPDGSGSRDGSSWSNALSGTALQGRLATATSGTFLVGAGLYKPTTGTDRGMSFVVPDAVQVYGGYAGSGPTPNARTAYPSSTTLSANIGDATTSADNSFRVVALSDYGGLTRLDGLVITGGRATGQNPNGGGIYNNGDDDNRPMLVNLLVVDNLAAGAGGGLYNDGFYMNANPRLINCSFQGNSAGRGGGVYNLGYEEVSSPILTNVTFIGNSASIDGGAMHNVGFAGISSPILTNVAFIGNSAKNGGAMYSTAISGRGDAASDSQLTNVSFANNTATEGGAMYNSNARPTISNGVFFGNGGSKAFFNAGSSVNASYSLFEQGVTGYTSGPGNLTTVTSPFVSPTDARLRAGATAIDAGNNEAYQRAAGPGTDLAGNARIANGTIDMGAFEVQTQPQPTITGLAASPSTVCAGSPVTFTATVGNVTGSYSYTLTNGTSPLTGTTASTAFSQSLTVGGLGPQTYTLTLSTSGQTASASIRLTVNEPPTASLTSNGPLTCAQTSVTLTASPSGQPTYAFAGPGLVSQSGNQATVNASGLYSVTLTDANGCRATATTTVGSNANLPAPGLQASASQTSGQPISVTASGCAGTINWLPQGGAGQANGNVYTFTQPGNYTLSATCTLNSCTSPAATPLVLQIRPGGLAITGVTMVNCQLTDAAKGEYQVRFSPQYAGANANPIVFAVVNELAAATQPAPYQLRLYTDNPVITLIASQAGNNETRFLYEWLASCGSGSSPNQPPVTSGIPNQQIVEGQPYQLRLSEYFSDPAGQPLTYSASGLPGDLSLSGSIISGSPQNAGVSQVTVTALDPGGLQVSTSFSLSVSAAPANPGSFTITGVSLVSCELVNAPSGEYRIRFNPQYSGLTGQPVRFSVVNELAATTEPGPYSLRLYSDNPSIGLVAGQGSSQASFIYNWLGACGSSGRLPAGGSGEPGAGLRVVVLGNPVVANEVALDVRGAEGQPLRVQVVDERGHLVSQRLVERAGVVERLSLPVGNQPAGVFLLRVSTPTHQRTLKLLRAK